MIDLTGQTALVTGSARGIGNGIAAVLARAGASVVVADLDGAAAQAAAGRICDEGGAAFSVAMDVTSTRGVQRALDEAASYRGGLQILVNNAGVFQRQLGLAVDDEDFSHCLDVNTVGAWRVVRAALPYLRKASAGTIINIASNGGRQAIDFAPAYCASKAAVVSLTQSLAMLLGREGIRVNAVCPGRVATELLSTIQRLKSEQGFVASAGAREPVLAGELTAADVGNAVAFLASPLARYITGQALVVDRGWAIV